MTLPPLEPETTAAGIAVDPRTQDRVVPATRRPDGTVRKELKIRPGFTPQEDATRFRGTRQQTAEQNTLPRGHIPGWVAPSSETKAKRGGRPGAATSSGGARSLEAIASGNIGTTSTTGTQEPISKSAKKNAKRSEKKKEEKQKALEEKIKAAWDDDSEDDIPRPAKKGKAPASGSTPKADSDATPETLEGDNKLENAEDDTAEVVSKVADLNI